MTQKQNRKFQKQKISSVIVEDEKKSQAALTKLLEQYCPEIEINGYAETVASGLELIETVQPQLIFLDIALPDGDGFSILEQLKFEEFHVVFVTAYDKYAIRAFEFSTLNYILKPVSHIELCRTIDKFKKITVNDSIDYKKGIDSLKDNIKGSFKKIMLPTTEGFEMISLDNVVRFEANHNYTYCHLRDNNKILVSRSLINFETLLEDLNFVRVHSKHLVNLKYIIKYQRGSGGIIKMADGSEINVSRSRKNEFFDKLERFSHHL